MERMRQVYSEQAEEAGVLLVSSCGFDSIPNDLGALYLQRSFQGELAYVDSYLSTTGVSCLEGLLDVYVYIIYVYVYISA